MKNVGSIRKMLSTARQSERELVEFTISLSQIVNEIYHSIFVLFALK